MTPPPAPLGRPTRGTTGTNRLRRVDRWIARHPVWRGTVSPLIVDLGFGASGVTVFELEARLRRTVPDVRVRGLDIDPKRVARAQAEGEQVRAGHTPFPPDSRVTFARGGFEVPGERPLVIRAFNVLRQYDDTEVADAWAAMSSRVLPGGLVVEGTCDEIGRVSSWIAIGSDGIPQSLTISLRLASLDEGPHVAAERLPKALIHRNIPGEGVHDLLAALDHSWRREAPQAVFGPQQRWRRALESMRDDGWPLLARSRWRLGEVTVPWSQVAPRG